MWVTYLQILVAYHVYLRHIFDCFVEQSSDVGRPDLSAVLISWAPHLYLYPRDLFHTQIPRKYNGCIRARGWRTDMASSGLASPLRGGGRRPLSVTFDPLATPRASVGFSHRHIEVLDCQWVPPYLSGGCFVVTIYAWTSPWHRPSPCSCTPTIRYVRRSRYWAAAWHEHLIHTNEFKMLYNDFHFMSGAMPLLTLWRWVRGMWSYLVDWHATWLMRLYKVRKTSRITIWWLRVHSSRCISHADGSQDEVRQ